MAKYKLQNLILIILLLLPSFTHAALDATMNGMVFGEEGGLKRVQSLENQLHAMQIKSEHPRIILTPELITLGKARLNINGSKWPSILLSANSGNTINAAFAYLMTDDMTYATTVYNNIISQTASTWSNNYTSKNATGTERKVAEWAIAYDWVYNGLTSEQRIDLINKIGLAANIAGRADWIRSGNRDSGETFHREEWIFYPWRAWPELALAGEYTDADFNYKSRWTQNFFQGDAARAYAYLNDGTPLEGYQYGADATSWFMALKSATEINLVDGNEFHYDKSAADYQLYSMDFGLKRNIFHKGVRFGAGGLAAYIDQPGENTNWKLREYHSMATQLTAADDPYQQWFAKNVLSFDSKGASNWIFSNEYENGWADFENIATLLFYNPNLSQADPRQATYEQLPFAKHFDGGNEVYMRSSWSENAAMAVLRSTPAFTKTSHGDFDANTLLLYRKGNLAPDSGVYDTYQNQSNYFGYQKNTVAHNDILIIDSSKADAPTKLSGSTPDPGGTELVGSRNFSSLNPIFTPISNTFLLNKTAAEWGDILKFETSKDYDYAVSEAARAYGSRTNEFSRAGLFIRRPNDKAYFVVFDRINSTNANFQKKWLLHTVGEPVLNGAVINTEVPGNIYTVNGDSYVANNAFNNSSLYGKVLLPQDHSIRKIGGGTQASIVSHNGKVYISSKNHTSSSDNEPGVGANWSKYWAEVYQSAGPEWQDSEQYVSSYEFWVDGTNPRNWSIDKSVLGPAKEPFMGGPLEEIGQWRLEVVPNNLQDRDIFLNVIYMGDTGENPADSLLLNVSDSTRIGIQVKDTNRNQIVIFNKNKYGIDSIDNFNYDVNLTTSSSEHIIIEIAANTAFNIKMNGAIIETINSSAEGILSFETDIMGLNNFSISPAFESDTAAPSAPSRMIVE